MAKDLQKEDSINFILKNFNAANLAGTNQNQTTLKKIVVINFDPAWCQIAI